MSEPPETLGLSVRAKALVSALIGVLYAVGMSLRGEVLPGIVGGILAGILFAFVGCITHLMFSTAHPVAAVTIIALDVLVIYALCVYGFENRDPLR